ncbi:MAG: FAD-dependent oxidoreductase, partial [Ruthenibacterium sp.]
MQMKQSLLQKLQKNLAKQYGTAVQMTEENSVLTLRGHLAAWGDVVAAGRLCADKKSRWHVVNEITCDEKDTSRCLPHSTDTTLDGISPEVLIIGGGVVGCAIARELSRWKLDILLVEKE